MVVLHLIDHVPRILPAVAPDERLVIRSLYIFPNIVAHEAEELAKNLRCNNVAYLLSRPLALSSGG